MLLLALVLQLLPLSKAAAQEAYAVYTATNTTLTFYYDNSRVSRPGTLYDLNSGPTSTPQWYTDNTYKSVTTVRFDFSFADARPTTTSAWFYGMSALTTIIGIDKYLNTSEVESMFHMFSGCRSLKSIELSNFDTSKVTMPNSMFYGCSGLSFLDLTNFSTASFTDMAYMFYGCSGLTTIYVGDDWNVANVRTTSSMFEGCTSLVGSAGTTFDATHTDKAYAHVDGGASNPGYLTAAEPYVVFDDGTLLFCYGAPHAPEGGKLYSLNTGNDKPGWYKDGTYQHVTYAEITPSFEKARPTTTASWFQGMEWMEWIEGLFYLNTSEVTNMSSMFDGCGLSYIDLSDFDTQKVTDMYCMFSFCTNLRQLFLTNFDTKNVRYMSGMFMGCVQLEELYLSSFDTHNVTEMGWMFEACQKLKTLDLSSFDTQNVFKMSQMFFRCNNLSTIDLSSFDTHNVTEMDFMFAECPALTKIYVGDGWTTANVEKGDAMFNYCKAILGRAGTTYDQNHTDFAYARVDGGKYNPGYLSTKPYAELNETTLTFYNDGKRNQRTGKTYDLNYGYYEEPGWLQDGDYIFVKNVVFDDSFRYERPTSTISWFANMADLNSISGMNENLNTSEVTNMSYMFSSCPLQTIDVSNFDTRKVEDMNYMFSDCENLETLDLSNFDTRKVWSMFAMFADCEKLKTITVGNKWNVELLLYNPDFADCMIENCYSLVGGAGTKYDANHIDATYAHIDGGPSNPGYLTGAAGLKGDVNGDGQVGIGDIVAITNIMAGIETNSAFIARADVNGDNQVGIGDIVAITNIMAGIAP